MISGKFIFQKNHNALIYLFFLSTSMAILFLAGLGNSHLHGSTELRVAGIAAAMDKTGEMIVPMLNGDPFLEKPPLYFWIGSTIFKLLGENSYAARLPSAIAAIE